MCSPYSAGVATAFVDGTADGAAELAPLERSGAMIAAAPAEPDTLAVPGGDPPERLHVTLAYLGPAADLPADAAQAAADAARFDAVMLVVGDERLDLDVGVAIDVDAAIDGASQLTHGWAEWCAENPDRCGTHAVGTQGPALTGNKLLDHLGKDRGPEFSGEAAN